MHFSPCFKLSLWPRVAYGEERRIDRRHRRSKGRDERDKLICIYEDEWNYTLSIRPELQKPFPTLEWPQIDQLPVISYTVLTEACVA